MPFMPSRKLIHHPSDWIVETENSLRFLRLLSHDADGPDLSVALVEIDGVHRELRTLNSSRLYVILEGSFQFTVTPADPVTTEVVMIDAAKNDLVLIERGDWYSFKGTGKYLVINGPAIRPGDDIYSGR